jgi:transposase-like protein
LRRLVAADGTFLTGRFVLTLLLAIGIDADGRNVILAWAVVESENRDSWEYFLRLLRRCIPEVSSEPCVFVSDRDKGLLEADAVLGEHCLRAYCCKHLEGNLKDQFGAKAGLPALFWKVARARLPSGFEHHMAKIDVVNPAAAQYLRSIPAELWAVAYFPKTRYSHLTSNIAEFVNKILREDRSLSIIELLDAIWHRVMTDRASRLRDAQKQARDAIIWTSYCRTKLEYGRKWAHSNKVSLLLLLKLLIDANFI